MIRKLNIGCGWRKIPGFINIDIAKEVKPDMIVNIEKGLPFKDNYFDEIYSSHTLEHVTPEHWRFVLREIGRVAKHGCILELYQPFDNISQRTNIDHYRTFSYTSFDEFCLESSHRKYYFPYRLKSLIKKPNKLRRIFYQLFPYLKGTVHYKFMIIKEGLNVKEPSDIEDRDWSIWGKLS